MSGSMNGRPSDEPEPEWPTTVDALARLDRRSTRQQRAAVAGGNVELAALFARAGSSSLGQPR